MGEVEAERIREGDCQTATERMRELGGGGGGRELEKNRGPEVMRTRIRERERKREEIVWCT